MAIAVLRAQEDRLETMVQIRPYQVRKETLGSKVIKGTLATQEKRETKEIKEIREIREIKETSVHRVYKASRDPKEWLVRKAIQETSVHLVLFVVVLGVGVAQLL